MKKLLSAVLALTLLCSGLSALADEEYVYPENQAVAENYAGGYLTSHDGPDGRIIITGFHVYFSHAPERISLYEFTDLQLFHNGVPIPVEMELDVTATPAVHTDSTEFFFDFTQTYTEPGVYLFRFKFQGREFFFGPMYATGPTGATPADGDALIRAEHFYFGYWPENSADYGVYDICRDVAGFSLIFQGVQDFLDLSALQDVAITRNGVTEPIAWVNFTSRFINLQNYDEIENPTASDFVTGFVVDFERKLTEPGVYAISGTYQGQAFEADDILILPPEQVETLLYASRWAHEKLSRAIGHGLVPDGTPERFKQIITRAEFCALAARYLEAKTHTDLDAFLAERGDLREAAFSDTDDAAVLALARLGVVVGVGDGRFNPDGSITRQEAAQIVTNLHRCMGAEDADPPHIVYKDSGEIAPWARHAVDYAAEIKAMEGDGVLFRPLDHITHQESVIVWENLYRHAGKRVGE